MNADVCVLCLPVCVHLCAKNNNNKKMVISRRGQAKVRGRRGEGGGVTAREKRVRVNQFMFEKKTRAIRFIFTVLKNMLSGGNAVTTCLECTHPLFQVVIGLVRNLRHDHQGGCSGSRETNKQTNKQTLEI